MSTPDFNDIEYEPEKPGGRTASDDAETCVDFFCRLPLTTCAIFGGLFIGIGYLIINPNPLLQLLGVLVIVAIVSGLYYRFRK